MLTTATDRPGPLPRTAIDRPPGIQTGRVSGRVEYRRTKNRSGSLRDTTTRACSPFASATTSCVVALYARTMLLDVPP
jgi:hypothetical protein